MHWVDLSKYAPVATIALQRPPANAMNVELTEQIAKAFDKVASDPGVRAVVLTGQASPFPPAST